MIAYPDCFPCIAKQAVDVMHRLQVAESRRLELVRHILLAMATQPQGATPVRLAAEVHRVLRRQAGREDLYLEEKKRSNAVALEQLPSARAVLRQADDPLWAAARMAVAANIIDYGAMGESFDLTAAISECLEAPLAIDDLPQLARGLASARKVVYVGDNSGEIVFDRIFIEEIRRMSEARVIYVARGKPILNDVTLVDARQCGMQQVADLTESAGAAPGCELDRSGNVLRRHFEEADVVIAKGQGNYEALSDEIYNIFFLLRIKCPVIAQDIGAPKGQGVIMRSKITFTPAERSPFPS